MQATLGKISGQYFIEHKKRTQIFSKINQDNKPSKQELCDRYFKDNLTQKQIANLYNINVRKLQRWFKSYNIQCGSPKTKWTKNKVKKFFNEHDLEIINFDEYENVQQPVHCYDKEGFIVKASVKNLKMGYKPNWFKYNNFAKYNIKHYCSLNRPNYKFVDSAYKGSNKKHKFLYIGDNLPKNVSNIFKVRIDSFIYKNCGHPYLSDSKGETKIYDFLINHNINFETQYSFDKCKYKDTLRFDFGIFEDNKLKCLIEYNGKQHYKPVEYFGGQEEFELQKKRDKIKKDFCKKNDIKLYIIPYWMFNDIGIFLKDKLGLN